MGEKTADEEGDPPVSRRNMEKRIAREGMCRDLAVLLLAGIAAALCTVLTGPDLGGFQALHSLRPKVRVSIICQSFTCLSCLYFPIWIASSVGSCFRGQ